MPPPMPNPAKRITANPIRPARYRPGKAVQEEESSDEESEDEIQEQRKSAQKSQARAQLQRKAPAPDVEDEDEDEEGFVTEEDEDNVPPPIKTTASVPSRPSATAQSSVQDRVSAPSIKQNVASESEDQEDEESSDESGEDSEEEDSSSEDEPQRKFQRPTFVRKADRQKSTDQADNESTPAAVEVVTSAPDVDEQARRLEQAELLIKDKLERDAIARSQGKKAWDDDEEVAPEAQVDDTDDLDPAAEHAAWKLRELKRLKRDREAIEAREREIEETERRRNLTQEERAAEDKEFIDKQKAERDEHRSQASYLAKYHHKGAFFQDDEMAEILKKRDLIGARFEDEVTDKSALPEYMRVRDMTKLGKKGRTRYTDLKGQDTGRFGEDVRRWRGSGYANDRGDGQGGQDLRGVDERFLPDRDGDRRGNGNDGPTGANASAVGQRRERKYSRSRSRSRSPIRRRHDGQEKSDSYRPRRRSNSYSRSRSRSRTPPRRKRSPSPYADREKRRKLQVD